MALIGLQSTAAARNIVEDPLILVNTCGKELNVALGECKNLILSQEESPSTLSVSSGERVHLKQNFTKIFSLCQGLNLKIIKILLLI